MDTTLVEMIARLKSLGAKDPCEHTKKLLTAIWLHLRGDGVNLHSTMRNCAKEMVKRKLTQHLKTFKPDVYIERLNLDELRRNSPEFYAKAYLGADPCPLPGGDKAAIMYLDTLMQCRGGGGINLQRPELDRAPQQQQLQLQAPQFLAQQAQPQNLLQQLIKLCKDPLATFSF